MRGKVAVGRMLKLVLLCLILGSLFGGLIGIVVAGAAGTESGLPVVTSW